MLLHNHTSTHRVAVLDEELCEPREMRISNALFIAQLIKQGANALSKGKRR